MNYLMAVSFHDALGDEAPVPINLNYVPAASDMEAYHVLKFGSDFTIFTSLARLKELRDLIDKELDADWQRRTAEAAELREEQEWDAAQMNETGADRTPPRE